MEECKTLFVVCSMFWVAGYGDTAFYPSLEDPMSSLTIRNSSSSKFTLEVMSYVSVLVPFVAAYIWYVWRSMDRKKLTRRKSHLPTISIETDQRASESSVPTPFGHIFKHTLKTI